MPSSRIPRSLSSTLKRPDCGLSKSIGQQSRPSAILPTRHEERDAHCSSRGRRSKMCKRYSAVSESATWTNDHRDHPACKRLDRPGRGMCVREESSGMCGRLPIPVRVQQVTSHPEKRAGSSVQKPEDVGTVRSVTVPVHTNSRTSSRKRRHGIDAQKGEIRQRQRKGEISSLRVPWAWRNSCT